MSILKKFTSRKFLCCLAGASIGVISMLYLEGTLPELGGCLAAVASLVSYIRAEGEVDKAAAK
jgi:hypothetical protein